MYIPIRMELFILVLTTVSIIIILKIYLIWSSGVCRSKRTLEGKTVIITGANTGIGLETARDLAKRNARVILACRNLDKGQKAVEDIISTSQNHNVVVKHLDLASLTSVREFAKGILDKEKRLDILINNAGVAPPPGRHMTEDNLELQFATNHFGPFLLTLLLLPLLKKSAPSRIIMVSSILHIFAKLDLENLNCEKYERYPLWIYCSTKLANILFAHELNKQLSGTRVTVNSLHPGGVKTSIGRDASGIMKYFIIPIVYFFLKDCVSGAQTTIYLAVAEEVENISDKYFVDCKPSWTSSKAVDDKLSSDLWKLSESFTGIKH